MARVKNKVSEKIFDVAVIGFKWGKTFWLSRHEANFDFEYLVFCFDSIIQSLDATHFLKTNSIMSLKELGLETEVSSRSVPLKKSLATLR